MFQGLSAWFAWVQFQELNSESGAYQSAEGNAASRQNAPAGHSDPFQSYVPPQSQQNAYQQHQQQEQRAPSQPPEAEAQRDTKTENLI